MQVDLVFHHPAPAPDGVLDFEEARDLEALPRVGDNVLWTDTVTTEGTELERHREYVVRGVDWSMGSDTTGAAVRVRLDFAAYGEAPTTGGGFRHLVATWLRLPHFGPCAITEKRPEGTAGQGP